MTADVASQTLSAVELLSTLPAEEVQRLEARVQWHRYEANEQIIDREADSQDVFFIVQGKVRVVNFSLSGREISFDDIDEGG